MRKLLTIAFFFCATAAFAQENISVATATEAPTTAQPTAPLFVKRDTPLELLATKEVTTDNAVAGTRFKLRLNKAVIVNGVTTIPVGTWAHGEVVTASDAGILGRSGKMTARLLYLEYGTVHIPIDGRISSEGSGAGSAGAAVIFSGIAGLFHRGNNAKIKAGEIVNAFVAEDTVLNSSATN